MKSALEYDDPTMLAERLSVMLRKHEKHKRLTLHPLHLAARFGAMKCAAALCAQGLSADVTNGEGVAPLHVAAAEGREEMVRLLISLGANVNRRSMASGETPLCMAARLNVMAGVKALTDAGADFEISDIDGRTPLFVAAVENNGDVAGFLLRSGAKPNTPSNDGLTPVFAAAAFSSANILREMIKAGGNHSWWGPGGSTPLHWAAYKGRKDTAELLISLGASASERDDRGLRPTDVAAAAGHDELSELLRT